MVLRQRLRTRKTGMCFLNAAHCLQYLAQVVMQLWVVGNQRECLLIMRDRTIEVVHCCQYVAEIGMRQRITRVEQYGLAKAVNRAASISHSVLGAAHIGRCFGQRWLKLQRAPITFNGGAVIAGILACIAQVAMRLGVCGTELYRALQHRQCVLALRLQSGAEGAPGEA